MSTSPVVLITGGGRGIGEQNYLLNMAMMCVLIISQITQVQSRSLMR